MIIEWEDSGWHGKCRVFKAIKKHIYTYSGKRPRSFRGCGVLQYHCIQRVISEDNDHKIPGVNYINDNRF